MSTEKRKLVRTRFANRSKEELINIINRRYNSGERHTFKFFVEERRSRMQHAVVENAKESIKRRSREARDEATDNGRIGGRQKYEKGYQKFVKWVEDHKFNVAEYENVSGENLTRALKDKGYNKIKSPKTAAKYRDRYLSELASRSVNSSK